LVSELVTNVVLHAGTDVDLRCYTYFDADRFEERDGSDVFPGLRHYNIGAATGRGLALVDKISTRWGANSESQGKVVWFQVGEIRNSPPQLQTPVRRDRREDDFVVRLEGLPVAMVRATLEHGDALLRALVMFDMWTTSEPGAWRSPQIDLTPVLEPVHNAHGRGLRVLDLEARFPRSARVAALVRLTKINEAEELTLTGALTASDGLPELKACRTWLLSEIALQGEGRTPTPWNLPEDLEPRGASLTLSRDEQRALQQAGTATLVGDATHRIIFATDAAGVLLGWPAAALVGQRISVIVPVEQREAHLAGFARYAVTKQPRLIGRTALVPALRRDGSVVELSLTLRKITFLAGDAFAAELEEPSTSDARTRIPSE
jgi:PAS domain S-box-containing protein